MIGETPAGDSFRRLGADRQVSRRFANGNVLFSTYEVQVGSAALPGTLALSIGGAGVVRGFEAASVSAPSGLRMTHELSLARRAEPGDAAEPDPKAPKRPLAALWRDTERYVFADFGLAVQTDGEQSRMVSVGMGLRLNRPKFTVDLGLALPLEGFVKGVPSEAGLRLSVSRKLF